MFRLSWSALIGWLWIRTAQWEEIGGFQVNIFPAVSDAHATTALQNLAEALEQLQLFDPTRCRQTQHYMRRIMVRPVRRSHLNVAANICMLDLGQVLADSPAGIASTIIHEATHARLAQAGVRYTPRLEIRIEKICVAAELAFVRKLPEGRYRGKAAWIAQLSTYIAEGRTAAWNRVWENWDEQRSRLLQE